MSNVSGQSELDTSHSDQLLELASQSGRASQTWFRYLITIQGALATGFGYLVLAPSERPLTQAALALCVWLVGVVLTWALTTIILRVHRWQTWYVKRYIAIPGNVGRVFPGIIEPPLAKIPDDKQISNMDPGFIGSRIRRVAWWMGFAWAIAAIWMVLPWRLV